MENFWNDIRFGLRVLLQKPAFTAIAVLTLALGIGANTAIFTLFDSVLLQKLPVRDPGQLVLFTNETGEGTRSSDSILPGQWDYYSWENYQYLRQQPLPFIDLAAYRSGQGPVSVRTPGANGGDAQVQRATVHPVSGNFFDVMGVPRRVGPHSRAVRRSAQRAAYRGRELRLLEAAFERRSRRRRAHGDPE